MSATEPKSINPGASEAGGWVCRLSSAAIVVLKLSKEA